ncbi:MAG: HNH endonuclease [Lachnospiraceae bacterium]|nr:HNH endonuclease [Lachnospiraceae bacterium]
MNEIDILSQVTNFLAVGNVDEAKQTISHEYPFTPVRKEGRNYTVREMLEQFCRDGFIDRYSGNKLIHPGILRVFSEKMPKEFPYQAHWKTDECHIAYWEYQPTIDHIYPISLGGADAPENWASTSMINNTAKGNFTLEQLGWTLKPAGDMNDWDGLSGKFLELVEADTSLLGIRKIKEWYIATKRILETDRYYSRTFL